MIPNELDENLMAQSRSRQATGLAGAESTMLTANLELQSHQFIDGFGAKRNFVAHSVPLTEQKTKQGGVGHAVTSGAPSITVFSPHESQGREGPEYQPSACSGVTPTE